MNKNILYIFLIGCIVFCQSVLAQSGSGDMMRGKVVSDIGEELISAQVVEVDKNNRIVGHTLTDMNGEFSLTVFNSQNTLRVTYLGFKQWSSKIGSQRNFKVVMSEDNVLETVEIVQKRTITDGTLAIPESEVTFAMQKLNTKELEGMQITSIDDALQGKIAGLDIMSSGDLGKGSSMRIRGTASINGNVQPLIVMNGIPREDISITGGDLESLTDDQFADLLSVNPDDILEITVLKDAASTSVWGSRGANGVLMINTKKGVSGPTRINYTYKFSGSKQPVGLKMLDGNDYTMMMKQALFNAKHAGGGDNVEKYLNMDEINYRLGGESRHYNNNTDWRKAVIQNGFTHDHYLVVSGGGEKANFRVAGGYLTSRGTIIGQSLDRFTARMDLDYYVSSRIRFTSEFMFSYTDNARNWTEDGNLLDIAYKKMPNLAIYSKDKDTHQDLDTYYNVILSGSSKTGLPDEQAKRKNPVALGNLASNNLKQYSVQPVLRLRYDLLDPDKSTLQYNVWVSFNMRNEKVHRHLPKEATPEAYTHNSVNNVYNHDSENFGLQTENSLTWQPKFEDTDHSLSLYAGYQTNSGNSNSQTTQIYGLPTSEITNPSADAKNTEKIESYTGLSRSLGVIGRAHYAYKGKYILGLTFRRDGSTRFGRSNKYGNFPGVSLRWNISDEPFMEGTKGWLDMLSIKPNWGITGNPPAAEYLHFSKYKVETIHRYGDDSGTRYAIMYPEGIKLTDLKWEKTSGFNLGFDLAVLDYTYVLDVNFYHQRTSDLLFKDTSIPTSSGFSKLAYRNAAIMDNDGWEINLNANKFFNIGNVTFDLRFNIANSVNTLISLDQDILDNHNKKLVYNSDQTKINYLQNLQVNKSYGSIYGFRYKGVYAYSMETYKKGGIPVGQAPVATKADGTPMLDARKEPMPMYFGFYQLDNNRYQFQAGDAIYEDINHDGTIDELDVVYLGNSNPLLNGGFGLTARWKQLSATFFTTFRYGNKIINKSRMDAEKMYSFDNQSIAVNWRWRVEGPQDDRVIPRALYNAGFNSLPSDRYVEDGSYLRLKYIQVNYALPSNALKKYGIRQMSLYLTVNNIFCLTKYQGVDPEVDYSGFGISQDNATTPRSKDFTLGVSVGF